jgi:hypothetical protein
VNKVVVDESTIEENKAPLLVYHEAAKKAEQIGDGCFGHSCDFWPRGFEVTVFSAALNIH